MGVDQHLSHRGAAARDAAVGCAGLAAAMGIGRFAFTPLMPLMQDVHRLSLADAAGLASANYLGYLVGAVACVVAPPRPAAAARWGLVAVACTTLPMAATDHYAAWLVLRLACGIASACVLVGVSAWALPRLAAMHQSRWAGWVYAGVGAGIVLAGLAGLFADRAGIGPDGAWGLLGALAAAAAIWAWRPLEGDAAAHTAPPQARGVERGDRSRRRGRPLDRTAWLMVICYGAFGLGYIVPATFIPAMARALVSDPAVFGWAWPVFGAAAAVSTVVASTRFGRAAPRHAAVAGLLLMAVGVAAPAVHAGLAWVLAGAVLVGGTFMVVTMASMQLAREHAPADAAKLMAAMTAAFAVGQLLGPLMVGLWPDADRAFGVLSLAAAVVLLVASGTLAAAGRRVTRAAAPTLEERTADA
jgi:predicted MFS family arabinose efflux permease